MTHILSNLIGPIVFNFFFLDSLQIKLIVDEVVSDRPVQSSDHHKLKEKDLRHPDGLLTWSSKQAPSPVVSKGFLKPLPIMWIRISTRPVLFL